MQYTIDISYDTNIQKVAIEKEGVGENWMVRI